MFITGDVFSMDEAVAADDLFFEGIPDDELDEGLFGSIIFIDIDGFSCTAACIAKGVFPEPADFAHEVGGAVGGEDIDLVVAVVGVTDEVGFCEFFFENCAV